MKKILVLFFFIFLFLPHALFAYTNPGTPQGFVSDYAGMFSAEERTALEQKLQNYEKASTNEIAVVTIPDLGGDTIENFAVKLFEDWKIGKVGKDNGILILISRDDRKVRIEVGYGLEPELTDLESSALIRNVLTPAFKEGKYYDGVNTATAEIISKISGEPTEAFSDQGTQADEGVLSKIFPTLFFIFIFFFRILGLSRSWWLGGVLGGILGIVFGFIYGSFFVGIGAVIGFSLLGLLIDYIASKSGGGGGTPWMGGGFGRGSGGGGFGGFGGGHSGGGGSSGSW